MKNRILTLLSVVCLSTSLWSQSYAEGFDDLTTLTDWSVRNNSVSPNPNAGWGGGNTNAFAAQAGAPGSYLSCNFESTTSTNQTGVTISNWLFTPTQTYNNGDVITFYTRVSGATPVYPDRLELRFSAAGNGTDVGATPTSVGTYTSLLLSVNPNLTTTGYPSTWTLYSATISGLSGPTNGRVAFRYFVTDAGPGGTNSDYIGIDSYTYTSVATAPINDDCIGALNLIQGASCVNTTGTVAYATESQVACTGVANNDVWYKFTATATGASISVDGSPQFDGVFQVFSGNSCASLTSLNCTDNSVEGELESSVVNNLTIGQTYYIRVHDYLDDIPNTLTFDICVQEFTQCTLTQPANSLLENETCGADNNGGCNSVNQVYYNISCGQTVFGNAWADNSNRDTDWYRFQLGVPGTVSWSASAEFPYVLLLVDITNCASPTILASASFNACQNGSINYNFTATGNYAAVILPSVFSGYACNTNNDYIVTLNLPITSTSIAAQGQTSFCVNSSSTIAAATPTGGFQWFLDGNLIPNQSTSTLTATQGGTYALLYTNTNGCVAPLTSGLTLSTIPLDNAVFSFPSGTVCVGGLNTTPTASSTGTFSANSGDLVFANTSTGEVNVPNSLAGTYTITFLTNGTCPNTSTQQLSISNSLVADFSYASSSFCLNDANQQVTLLNGGGIGVFSAANGLSLNPQTGAINPSLSTVGSYQVTNTIAASGACPEASATFGVTINGTIVDFPAIATVCESATTFTLNATPVGGTFAGIGVENASDFNPSIAVGANTITYQYIDGNNCVNTALQTINVEANPVVTFGTYSPLCSNSSIITLNSGLPAGGTYIGAGISNNEFTPSVSLIGVNNTVYNYVSPNGCTGNAQGTITVNAVPTVTFEAIDPICENATPISLTQVTPAGGTFTGTGITGTNSFNPTVSGDGSHLIIYTFTENGCSGSAQITIVVNAAPVVIINTIDPICDTTAQFAITEVTPAGGTFSGNGISAPNLFTASVAGIGTHPIVYTVTQNGCTGSATQSIIVENCNSLEEQTLSYSIYPNPSTSVFTVKTSSQVEVSVFSIEGKVVIDRRIIPIGTTSFDCSDFAKGQYVILLTTEKSSSIEKIILE
jgi:hypothetical protein